MILTNRAGGLGWLSIVCLQKTAFEPEDVKRMQVAYEQALILLELKDREDPITESIARLIIEVAQTGEKDRTSCVHWP